MPIKINIANRILNRPLFLHPSATAMVYDVLGDRIVADGHHAALEGMPDIDASRFIGTRRRMDGSIGVSRAYQGVAMIAIDGALVNRGAWLDAQCGLTSYEGIAAQIGAAIADPEVKSIILDIDSPGGEATGMFGLAEQIRAARDKKPIVAYINDMACSAAYGIASSASEIVISSTSVVGHIGVVMLHLDRSAEMASKGIKPTFIHAGAHKVDGNAFEPLTEDVKNALQRDVTTFYDRFVEVVAAGRGSRTTAAMARETEAKTFIGQQAIDAGLADRVASLEDVITGLLSNGSAANQNPKERLTMSNQAGTPAADTNAGKTEDTTAIVAAANLDGAKQASARIAAILQSGEAEGRAKLANTLAFETEMSAEDAIKVMAAAGKDAGVTPTIEQRAASSFDIGSGGEPAAIDKIDAMWAKSITAINAAHARNSR